RIVAREPGVLAGVQVAALAFKECDPKIRVQVLKKDGQKFRRGDALLEVNGRAIPILSAERTALNFLRHLTGVATLTAKFVEKTKGTRAKIYDTRKTTPLLRDLEKYAVTRGGGKNHRRGLYDAVLIKDNHVAAAGSVRKAVWQARLRLGPRFPIQVECDTTQEVREALAAGADLILCDNMPPPLLRRVVREVKGKIPVEASGGVNLKIVRAIAKTGVDRISVGAITHSAPQVDLALDYAGKK
ncbi:MAG: carboxylating nicotinate-nucleotide diphosphorylase, partial [Bdellovibrionota bacterium]